MKTPTHTAPPVALDRLVLHLPELWEEIDSKTWVRAKVRVDGNLMGLKCELKLGGTKYRWMTLKPQKFGAADTLEQAIEQVESFLQNVKARSHGGESAAPRDGQVVVERVTTKREDILVNAVTPSEAFEAAKNWGVVLTESETVEYIIKDYPEDH